MMLPLPRFAAHRIACAVVAAEIRRLRERNEPFPFPDVWPEALLIGDEGLGLDSLEQLGALGALAETFGLDDALLGSDTPRTVGAWVDWIMHRHASGEGHLTVMTSGSTGCPLPCVHAVSDLIEEARFLATQVEGCCRVVTLVPAHHLYGIIWTALLPTVLNVPVVTRVLGSPLDLVAGDLVVAVPDQWRAMLRLTPALPADIVGISSAGPLDEALAEDLLASGLTRLLDIYGSSETGGIAIRELPATAYELLPRWHLLPDGESEWQLCDNRGGHHSPPDHIERISERSLHPIGRRDGAVQIGGHNVWPARIAAILREVDGVAEVAVRLHANGRLERIPFSPDHSRMS